MKGDTPEKAFKGFTDAMLRNRRKDVELYASQEYIHELEGVFDLIVISAAWPANVLIEKVKYSGNNKSALIARGVGRKNVTLYGTFLLKKEGADWRVVEGGWRHPFMDGTIPPAPTEKDLDDMLNPPTFSDAYSVPHN
jgi:hypothetical protein